MLSFSSEKKKKKKNNTRSHITCQDHAFNFFYPKGAGGKVVSFLKYIVPENGKFYTNTWIHKYLKYLYVLKEHNKNLKIKSYNKYDKVVVFLIYTEIEIVYRN